MKIELLKITDLKPAKYNPRKISEKMLEKLKANIVEFGMVEPLVVNKDMTVIGGHQRLKACTALDMKEVPCFVIDVDKEKEKKLNIALNKIQGDWDYDMLKEFTADVLKDVGFENYEISGIIKDFKIPAAEITVPKDESLNLFIVIQTYNDEDFENLQKVLNIPKKMKKIEYEEFMKVWHAKTATTVQE